MTHPNDVNVKFLAPLANGKVISGLLAVQEPLSVECRALLITTQISTDS
jgi:hypothetical protein